MIIYPKLTNMLLHVYNVFHLLRIRNCNSRIRKQQFFYLSLQYTLKYNTNDKIIFLFVHLYAINRLYKLLHDLPAAVRGFTDTNDIIAHFDENEDGELNFQEFLKGMTETGAFEKVAKKSLGKNL